MWSPPCKNQSLAACSVPWILDSGGTCQLLLFVRTAAVSRVGSESMRSRDLPLAVPRCLRIRDPPAGEYWRADPSPCLQR